MTYVVEINDQIYGPFASMHEAHAWGVANMDRKYRVQPVYGLTADETRSTGQVAYEADVAARPTYHDGTQRRTWNQLLGWQRWDWERV